MTGRPMLDRLWAGWRIPYVESDERTHERDAIVGRVGRERDRFGVVARGVLGHGEQARARITHRPRRLADVERELDAVLAGQRA